MYNTPPPNLMHGIQLVQAGRKADALPYLRHAARYDRLTADGWLWLAAATANLDEYRRCVAEALSLDPRHPTALRMRGDLQRHDRLAQGVAAVTAPGPAPAVGPVPVYAPAPDSSAPPRPSRLRRLLRAMVVLLIVGGLGAGVIGLAASGVIQDTVKDWFTSDQTRTLAFTVGGADDSADSYRFRVEMPDSWQAADTGDPAWRATVDTLNGKFPAPEGTVSVWDQVDEPFEQAARDPTYGAVLPNVRLVETDADTLDRDGMVAALTLQEILPLPDAPASQAAGICERLRTLEEQLTANGSLASVPDNEVIESALVTRADLDDCVFTIHRRYTNQQPYQVVFALSPERAPDATRSVTLMVPVDGSLYAVWLLTFADSAYDDYSSAIARIINTLVYVEEP
ncbi:MAG: hypothetical protein JXJ20_02655 [Anaerolineae bacterium]|nr:hypothetical protein [Anaerolineae bacterium]